jgi:GNAT superfamily N-acetyltransferase
MRLLIPLCDYREKGPGQDKYIVSEPGMDISHTRRVIRIFLTEPAWRRIVQCLRGALLEGIGFTANNTCDVYEIFNHMVAFLPVTENDLDAIRKIYDHYILNTTATFHNEPITLPELREFLFIANPKYPSFVMKERDRIIGYCFLTRFKKRQAYDRTAELSIYIQPEYTGRGIGVLALKYLEDAAKKYRYSCTDRDPVRGKPCQYPADGEVWVYPVRTPEKYR